MPVGRAEESALFAKHREAELAKAEAEAKARTAAPEKDVKPGTQATDAPVAVSSDAAESEGNADAPFDPATLDLSDFPEAIRSKVHFDDKEAYEEIKRGWMAKQHHSRIVNEHLVDAHATENWKKATAHAPVAKAITTILLNAEKFDDAARDRVIAAIEAESNPVVEEEPVEIDLLDPKARQAEIDQRAEAIADRRIKATLDTIQKPEIERQATNAALSRYFAAEGIPEALAHAAMELWRADPKHVGMNPETAGGAIGPYVQIAKLQANTNGAAATHPAANGKAGLTEVASPTSRGGSSQSQPVPLPKHIQENRKAETTDELEQEMLYAVRKRMSPSLTLEALRGASR